MPILGGALVIGLLAKRMTWREWGLLAAWILIITAKYWIKGR